MAVNEKPIFAAEWTTHGGRIFRPGDRMDTHVDPYVTRSALESGLATDSAATAKRAADSEGHRAADVQDQIARRSEKRDHEKRADKRS